MIEIKVHHIHEIRQPHQADLMPKLVQFMEKIVSQQEELMEALGGIKADVVEVTAKIGELHAQLEQLQQTTPPQVDLSAAIALAGEIRSGLEAIGATDEDAVVDQGGGDPTPDAGSGEAPAGGDQAPAGETGDAGAGEPTGEQPVDQPGPDQNGEDVQP